MCWLDIHKCKTTLGIKYATIHLRALAPNIPAELYAVISDGGEENSDELRTHFMKFDYEIGLLSPRDYELLHQMDLVRLASFKFIVDYNATRPDVSFTSLASAGFRSTCNGAVVQCDGCGQLYDLEVFVPDGFLRTPSQRPFHADHCPFINYDETNHVGNVNNNDAGKRDSATQNTEGYNSSDSTDTVPSTVGHHQQRDGDRTHGHINNSAVCPPSNIGVACGQDVSTMEDAGQVPDPVFVDKSLFESECARKPNANKLKPIHATECTKNPGHYGYFPIHAMSDSCLPSRVRYPEFVQLLRQMSILTVRIVISATSKARSRGDPALAGSVCQRVGTGFVTLSEQTHLRGGDRHDGRWGSLKKRVQSLIGLDAEPIYIETHRRLVYDEEEASNTRVEFFYDDPIQKGVKTVKGVGVVHSKTVGDYRSILVCKTSDHGLVQLLSQTRGEVLGLAEKLPQRAKEAMCHKIFIIHHPHGCEKVLSYGDSVLVKYDLRRDNRGQVNITRVHRNSLNLSDTKSIRKVLMYAADTCEGSLGAPILGFKNDSLNDSGQEGFVLDVWMHNGTDKTNTLGCSIMKVCTARQASSTTPQPSDSSDEEGSGNQKVTSPIFKVMTHPSYPSYIAYQKRLESYKTWTFSHIQSPVHLAKAGFFYAGYSDCSRCFQCGLGLRSWKQGDVISEQHRKHRPTCPYLQAHGDTESTHTETSGAIEVATVPEKHLSLAVLERETIELQRRLKCKVCHIEMIKDLFLPCGELYACTSCSQLLTHCPSCHKQIMGTVATFYS